MYVCVYHLLLDEVGNIARHLGDLRVVESLDVFHVIHILLQDEVDTDTWIRATA